MGFLVNLFRKLYGVQFLKPHNFLKLKITKPRLLISISFLGLFNRKIEIPDITTAVQLGHYYTLNSRFDEAEAAYHKALGFIQPIDETQNEEAKVQKTALLHVYYSLAQLYLIIGHLDNAERLILDCMRLCLQLGLESTDNAIVELSLLLSRLYCQQKKLELAETGFEFCLQTQNNKIQSGDTDQDSHALLGMTLYEYGNYCLLIGQFKRALNFYERGLSVAQELFEGNHAQISTMLNDMSTICVLIGQFERAEKLLVDAMKVAEQVEYLYLHRLYYNWAVVLSHIGRKWEAQSWFAKAEKMAKDCGDDEFLDTSKYKPN